MADERQRVFHRSGGRMMTKQADKDAADINNIVAKWLKTGLASQTGQTPRYGDFSSGGDYHSALSRVRQAEADFEGLPVYVRKACDYDVGRFLEMIEDPKQLELLEELGLEEAAKPPGPDSEEASEVPTESGGSEPTPLNASS